MKRKFLAAAIQMDTGSDYEENVRIAGELIDEACRRGADVVCLSENWAYQGNDYPSHAEDIPGGPTFEMLSEKARKYGIWLHGGSYSEKNEDPEDKRPYNTNVLIDPSGKLIAKYRKLHVFDVNLEGARCYRESDEKKPGDRIVVADTGELGKWGLSICYDIRFPELYRLMALEGADVLFAPASFMMMSGKDHWETLLRARAIENSCYVIAPNQIGTKWDGPTYGRSMIIDPWGNVLARAADTVGVITAEIDLDYRLRMKRQVITLENRRPDVYTLKKN